MADTNIVTNGNFDIQFDSNGNESDRTFQLTYLGYSNLLFKVQESGRVDLGLGSGSAAVWMTRGDTFVLDELTGSVDIVKFQYGSTTVANITSDGLLDASTGGVQVFIHAGSDPNGSLDGYDGDVCCYSGGGGFSLKVKNTGWGATGWLRIDMT